MTTDQELVGLVGRAIRHASGKGGKTETQAIAAIESCRPIIASQEREACIFAINQHYGFTDDEKQIAVGIIRGREDKSA